MSVKRVVKDTALAEITLRKYERPLNLSRRDLVKKLCLSIGLLQPGDSRDIMVDIFSVLLDAEGPMTTEKIQEQVIAYRKEHKLELQGVAASNIRRQLKRLRNLFLVEKLANSYRIAENEELHHLFEHKIKKFYLNDILGRVEEYFKALKE